MCVNSVDKTILYSSPYKLITTVKNNIYNKIAMGEKLFLLERAEIKFHIESNIIY